MSVRTTRTRRPTFRFYRCRPRFLASARSYFHRATCITLCQRDVTLALLHRAFVTFNEYISNTAIRHLRRSTRSFFNSPIIVNNATMRTIFSFSPTLFSSYQLTRPSLSEALLFISPMLFCELLEPLIIYLQF